MKHITRLILAMAALAALVSMPSVQAETVADPPAAEIIDVVATPAPAPAPTPAEFIAPEIVATAPAVGLTWQQTLIAVLVPVAVAGIKKVLPSLPKAWLPILAGALGLIGHVCEVVATGGTVNAALGLGLGFAGIGLREAAKHFVPAPATAAA